MLSALTVELHQPTGDSLVTQFNASLCQAVTTIAGLVLGFAAGASIGSDTVKVEGTNNVVTLAPVACSREGWEDTSANEFHIVVQSCFKDGWHVVLEDGAFARARHDSGGDWVTNSALVPGW